MLRTRAFTRLLLSSALVASAGCGDPLGGRCLAPRSIAVEVAVRDSLSGAARADSATATAVTGADTITLQRWDSLTLAGGDQLGAYVVAVNRPGYRPWTRSGVRVTDQGPCGNVIPVHLNARLQPLPLGASLSSESQVGRGSGAAQ